MRHSYFSEVEANQQVQILAFLPTMTEKTFDKWPDFDSPSLLKHECANFLCWYFDSVTDSKLKFSAEFCEVHHRNSETAVECVRYFCSNGNVRMWFFSFLVDDLSLTYCLQKEQGVLTTSTSSRSSEGVRQHSAWLHLRTLTATAQTLQQQITT